MADEEREEDLTDLIAAMASDHMMSFVHTPGFTSEEEEEYLRDQMKEFGDEVLHDLRLAPLAGRSLPINPANIATKLTLERIGSNLRKATALRNQTVTPTAGNTTLAFYLKGLTATRVNSHPRGKPPIANGYTTEAVEEGEALSKIRTAIITVARDLQINLASDQFTFGGAIKDDDTGDPLEFPFLSRFEGNPLDSNLWLPDIYDDGIVPKAVPKAVKDRLKAIRDDPIFAPLKKQNDERKRRAPIGKKEGISPITAYYIMRYLSPYLLSTGQVAQALPFEGKIRRIKVSRGAMEEEEFRDVLADLLGGSSLEGQQSIDDMFPFEAIRTKYQYPENYPEDHLQLFSGSEVEKMFGMENVAFIRCPEPTEKGVSVSYGLLQKIHAVMSPSRRNSMLNDLNEAFFAGATTRKFPAYNYTVSDTLSNRTADVHVPVRKNGAPTFDYAEVLLALLESDFRGLAKEDAIKLITNEIPDQYMYEKFVEELESQEPWHLQIIDNTEASNQDIEVDHIESKGTIEILNEYIEQTEYDNKDHVRELMKSLHDEAISL